MFTVEAFKQVEIATEVAYVKITLLHQTVTMTMLDAMVIAMSASMVIAMVSVVLLVVQQINHAYVMRKQQVLPFE